MELWIPITIAAAFLQNVRSTLQKQLKEVMGTTGATFVRFGFGVPVAIFYWAVLVWDLEYPVPGLSIEFGFWLVVGAVAQITAIFPLLYVCSFRNLTIGNAYSLAEPLQTAVFAFVLFGTQFNAAAILSICIAVAGVMAISVARTKVTPVSLITSVFSKTALIGLSAGTLFGLAAVGFQQTARTVESDFFIMQAATALLVGITIKPF